MPDAETSDDEVVDQQGELADELAEDEPSGGADERLTKERAQEGPEPTAGGGVP